MQKLQIFTNTRRWYVKLGNLIFGCLLSMFFQSEWNINRTIWLFKTHLYQHQDKLDKYKSNPNCHLQNLGIQWNTYYVYILLLTKGHPLILQANLNILRYFNIANFCFQCFANLLKKLKLNHLYSTKLCYLLDRSARGNTWYVHTVAFVIFFVGKV